MLELFKTDITDEVSVTLNKPFRYYMQPHQFNKIELEYFPANLSPRVDIAGPCLEVYFTLYRYKSRKTHKYDLEPTSRFDDRAYITTYHLEKKVITLSLVDDSLANQTKEKLITTGVGRANKLIETLNNSDNWQIQSPSRLYARNIETQVYPDVESLKDFLTCGAWEVPTEFRYKVSGNCYKSSKFPLRLPRIYLFLGMNLNDPSTILQYANGLYLNYPTHRFSITGHETFLRKKFLENFRGQLPTKIDESIDPEELLNTYVNWDEVNTFRIEDLIAACKIS